MAPLHHEPVMLKEVLEALALVRGEVVVDGTLGLAGHARELAKAVAPGGALIAFDWDAQMLEEGGTRLLEGSQTAGREKHGTSVTLVHRDYRSIGSVLNEMGISANGILLDLGLNSAQIEDPERGIAFKTVGPLDMRMNRAAGEPAAALLNRLSPAEIEQLLWDYGDERWAKAIAKSIVMRRKENPLRTTEDLVEAVLAAVPAGARDKRIHPATRTFQAVRIAVNRELEGLEEAIDGAAASLAPGGRLAVLSYHSGEDRAVKQVFRARAADGWDEVTRKPRVPGAEEIARNPRSRSAKLRILRRPAAER